LRPVLPRRLDALGERGDAVIGGEHAEPTKDVGQVVGGPLAQRGRIGRDGQSSCVATTHILAGLRA
jgi:hypothetical protein